MAGYDGYSMSNNARAAYDAGEKPRSKWTKDAMLRAIKRDGGNVDLARKLTVAELRRLCLVGTGWHHTGKLYNETNFYEVDADAVTEEAVQEMITGRSQRTEVERPVGVLAIVAYERYEGPYVRWRKWVRYQTEAIVVGRWAYTEDGKKDLEGKHCWIASRDVDITLPVWQRILDKMPAAVKPAVSGTGKGGE